MALKALQLYSWPGNVRELQNEVQRAIIQCMDGTLISVDDLSFQFIELLQKEEHIKLFDAKEIHPEVLTAHQDQDQSAPNTVLAEDEIHLKIKVMQPLKENIESIEKQMILKVLELTQHSKTRTASVLDLSREGLYKKMNKIGLDFSKQGDE